MSGRSRAALMSGGLILTAGVVLATLAWSNGGQRGERVVAPGATAKATPEGVGNIPASRFEARGIYLGPPGRIPDGTPKAARPSPPTTVVAGKQPTQPTSTGLGPEQQAVAGDPANGTSSITAAEATRVAMSELGGFTSPPTPGTPVLVQLDNVNTSIVATAWAVPVTGPAMLSYGPVPTGSVASVAVPAPVTETAVVFIDAVTGKFISEEGFAPS
jgi:hypothetical protein